MLRSCLVKPVSSFVVVVVNTDQVCDELRPSGADVLNSVEDVDLLFHLQAFQHVAGGTQQATATRSVSVQFIKNVNTK